MVVFNTFARTKYSTPNYCREMNGMRFEPKKHQQGWLRSSALLALLMCEVCSSPLVRFWKRKLRA